MSDGGGAGGAAAKRPKTDNDAGELHLPRIIEQLTVRVDKLTARNEELATRNAELESENRLLLRGNGNHDESLPPAINKTADDLSLADPTLVAQVASFLGMSRELLSLALVCKAFGWRQPSSTHGLSLVEEAARQFLANQLQPSDAERDALPQFNNDAATWLSLLSEVERLRLPLKFSKLIRNALPQYNHQTTTWLSILNEIERLRTPLEFNKIIGPGIEYCGSASTVRNGLKPSKHCTAMANYVMKRGVHYATYEIIASAGPEECRLPMKFGVARPLRDFSFVNEGSGFDMLNSSFFEDFLAQRTDGWVGDVHYCHIYSSNGASDWTDYRSYFEEVYWEGHESFVAGDTIGLLVDLNEGSLTVYKNGRRLGVAKNGLAGEYCFFTGLGARGINEVSIKRGTPPPGEARWGEI